jgi:hypothetical protein
MDFDIDFTGRTVLITGATGKPGPRSRGRCRARRQSWVAGPQLERLEAAYGTASEKRLDATDLLDPAQVESAAAKTAWIAGIDVLCTSPAAFAWGRRWMCPLTNGTVS